MVNFAQGDMMMLGAFVGYTYINVLDLPFWALGLKHPTSVEAEGPPVNPEGTPSWMIARWTFPARADLPPVEMTWHHGGKRPGIWKEDG